MTAKPRTYREVEDVEHALYEALERGDLDAFMAIWADEEDVICVLPTSQRLVGLDDIRAAWKNQLAQGPMQTRLHDTHTVGDSNTAVRSFVERRTYGESPQASAVFNTTAVFSRFPQGWRLIALHCSALQAEHSPSRSRTILH